MRIWAFVLLLAAAAAAERQSSGFFYTRTRERCSPQYWSSEKEAWPKMVPRDATLSNIFGSGVTERYRADMTLLEAAAGVNELYGGDEDKDEEAAFRQLMRQSIAALVNSYGRRGYAYASWEVKTLVIQALVSTQAAAAQAQLFLDANNNCG